MPRYARTEQIINIISQAVKRERLNESHGFLQVGWLKRAIEENPFRSAFFFWIDAGYGQCQFTLSSLCMPSHEFFVAFCADQDFTQQLCPCLAIHPDKVTIFSHSPPAREVFVSAVFFCT